VDAGRPHLPVPSILEELERMRDASESQARADMLHARCKRRALLAALLAACARSARVPLPPPWASNLTTHTHTHTNTHTHTHTHTHLSLRTHARTHRPAHTRSRQAALTPAAVVDKLDRVIIGQQDAKRAVAIAFRNRRGTQRLETRAGVGAGLCARQR
jgi:hypothetical protein